MVNPNRRNWFIRLDDYPWAYRTTYKAPLSMSPYIIIYGKVCHLPLELEHKAWEVKQLNMDINDATN